MLRGPCAFEYRLYQPRLYFITAGSVLYRGDDGTRESLGPGRCWGASDVLSLQSHVNAFRAVAASFLHVHNVVTLEMELELKQLLSAELMLRW